MANIAELLNNIMSAIYGKDVRKSIHDAIDAMNKESTHAGQVADTLDGKMQDGSLVGPRGEQGIQGLKGDKGLTGPAGQQGPKGDTGAQGIQGAQGLKGDKGDVGPQGEKGLKGDTGLQGPQGLKGETGDKGDKGDTGPKGVDGTSVTILGEKSSIADLPADAQRGDAYLIKGALYVWTGSEWANAGSIQGPQGLKGDKGDKGDTGAKGTDGNSVKIIGTVGSASELPAQAEKGDGYIISGHLHVWTGAAWSDVGNIQGPKGDKGDKGDTGVQGPKGDVGVTGITGPQGIQGLKGDAGSAGAQGPQGLKGDRGDMGPSGPQGVKGDTGPQGPAGSGGTVNMNNPVFTGSFSQNRKIDSVIGEQSHTEGGDNTASGAYSHAEGQLTVASKEYCHAEGFRTTSSNSYSHAEGVDTIASNSGTHAEGSTTRAAGGYSHAEGGSSISWGTYSHTEGYYTTADNYAAHAGGKLNKTMNDGGDAGKQVGDVFVIGNGTDSYSRSNAFRITYTGAVYGKGSFNTSGADYAEFIYEWNDGNLFNDDRVGFFVTTNNQKIRIAKTGDYIAGIISGSPSVVGSGDEDWLGRYERDEFNRVIMEDVPEMVEQKGKDGKAIIDEETYLPVMVETGELIPNARMKQVDGYDPDKPYVERKDRPEWDYVGMLGVIPVRDDGTCMPGKYCKCNNEGKATLCSKRGYDTYMVIERVTDNVVKVIMR